MTHRIIIAAATALTALAALPAGAATTAHIRGTVAAVDGTKVTIHTREGADLAITLDDGWKIGGVVKAAMTDIKPGTFIGTANVPGPNGAKALEVVVFPDAMKGTGEGDYGWDLQSGSSMTNATVTSEVQAVDGRALKLQYKGGEKSVTIPANVPIVTLAPATAADVKPGAAVFIAPAEGTDPAKPTKGFLAVGKDGAVPPM